MFSGILKICICFCEHVYMVIKFLLSILAQGVHIEIIFVLQTVLFSLHTCMAYSALPRRLNLKPQGLKLDIHMMSMALKLLAKV